MNLIELSELLINEDLAKQYLLEHNILKTFTLCEKCQSTKLIKISRGRYRCSNCMCEWNERKDSILHRQSISASQFLGSIKLFELELTAIQTSIELGLNERTVQRLYEKFREAIIETPHPSLTGIIKARTQNFAISINDGIVNISLNNNIDKANLFNLKRSRVPNKETIYCFSYINIKPREIEKCLNQLPNEQNHFWRYAKSKLLDYRGTKMESLYTILKEIEFRYNNKEGNIFDILVAKIAHFQRWR